MSLKSDKNNNYFIKKTFVMISGWNLLKVKNISNVVDKIKTLSDSLKDK